MKFYFAPMEGLTGYIYRNAHSSFFNPLNKYFSPFVSANESGNLKKRELEDLAPENNQGLVLVPQILTNNARDFVTTARIIKSMGYDEINLNLGCPSGTVVAKNKGSGFLAKPVELDAFLHEIFSWGGTQISIKTRIGKEFPEEFFELLDIFNKYPIKELTIHPRIRNDFYKNKPNMEVFRYALEHSSNPICYNGNIFTIGQYREFSNRFHGVGAVMMGRGLVLNPGLAGEINGGSRVDRRVLKEFHDRIYIGYKQVLSGDTNVLYKMKELWFYMIWMFTENEKYAKKIRKSTRLTDYEDIISKLFREQELLQDYEDFLDRI